MFFQMMNSRQLRGAELAAWGRLRRQRQCETIWRLGARVFFELIDELARHHTLHDLDVRLERYARLDPDVIRAVQADRFPQPIRVVPAPGAFG
jgi:hypothetical protein